MGIRSSIQGKSAIKKDLVKFVINFFLKRALFPLTRHNSGPLTTEIGLSA